jgi:hypothetical protein
MIWQARQYLKGKEKTQKPKKRQKCEKEKEGNGNMEESERNAIENFEPTKKAETMGLTHLIKNFIDQDFHSSLQI